MLRKSLTAVALIAMTACHAGGYASLTAAQAADQAPPMGGGYTNVIAIPVDPVDADDGKAIAGALIKPEGAGPFPTIVYISGCAGLDLPADKALQKAVIGHLTAKGFATFVVDLYTPRKEANGACENGIVPMARGARDIHAVLNVLATMPEVDANRVFLQGYSLGASSALMASDFARYGGAPGQGRRGRRVLSVLQAGNRFFGSDPGADRRQGRLDPGPLLSGDHRKTQSRGRGLSRSDARVRHAGTERQVHGLSADL